VPNIQELPVQPIIVEEQEEPGMFDLFKRYAWFLKVHRYATQAQLLAQRKDRVIGPIETYMAKHRSPA
jgi:hypothetical protein